jgi:hypothetical protein
MVKEIQTRFSSEENLKEARRPKNIGRTILKCDLKELEYEGVDWLYMAQDSDHWRAVVNTVVNLRVS